MKKSLRMHLIRLILTGILSYQAKTTGVVDCLAHGLVEVAEVGIKRKKKKARVKVGIYRTWSMRVSETTKTTRSISIYKAT